MDGWIKLYRKLTNNPMWLSEPFTRGQAWVDILLLSNHSDSHFYKRGNKIEVQRGQLGRSVVELADRWRWSRGKVKRFLNELQNEQQIEQQNTSVTTLLSVLNYEIYQGDGQQTEQQTEQQTGSRRAADGQQTDTYKNVKKEKNDKENINIAFNDFWELYKKKVGNKEKCEKKWNKLTDDERGKIMLSLPNWLLQFKDKQFQPYPETYLNNKRWNDVIEFQSTWDVEKEDQSDFSEYEKSK